MKAHQDNPHEGEDQVSDQVKFNVFQGIMDSLFQSFNASISVASFQELSACVFSWIEEHCEPQVRGSWGHGAEVLTSRQSGPSRSEKQCSCSSFLNCLQSLVLSAAYPCQSHQDVGIQCQVRIWPHRW